ncbi:uncharacterized protein K452DRAFT_303674 [Aplosporella prunicola CBS 121167]|uniref:Uncharacterized protein n=1 Tax=Aplosporella prunicola CBS 121167 TaxID=1176127 RepID=A0A6A6AU83_9PEZI|nr:uncharacterized protein K452DRAFT_303674 [Aplosporella prunicola CBS 121167]KAF2135260.1 hypothetical protein K452DRAFT_303674 [Aplosporella prunicola CBS 121167]
MPERAQGCDKMLERDGTAEHGGDCDMMEHNNERHTAEHNGGHNMAGHNGDRDMADRNGGPRTILNERVLVEWKDTETDQVVTLGSLSSFNKMEQKLSLKVNLDNDDDKGQGMVEFSMDVRVQIAGRKRREMEFSNIIPLSTVFSSDLPVFSYESLQASEMAGPVVSALENAGLSESGLVLRAHFCLHDGPVHTLVPKTNAKNIRPNSSTSRDLILGFKSFSQARTFCVYFKPSDCARQGLLAITQRLRNHRPVNDFPLADLCDELDVQPVNWTALGLDQEEHGEIPPSYCVECKRTPEAKQEPQRFKDSLGFGLGPSQQMLPSLFERHNSAIPETPLWKAYNEGPVRDEVSNNGRNNVSSKLNFNQQQTSAHVTSTTLGKRSAHERSQSLSNQQAEEAAIAKRRRVQLRLDEPPKDDYPLLIELTHWLQHASLTNMHVNEHPQLQPYLHALGQYARLDDKDAFTAARASCAAIFAFDPYNEMAAPVFQQHDEQQQRDQLHLQQQREEHSAACAFFIADMRRFVLWAFGFDPRADVDLQPLLFELGSEARRAVRDAVANPAGRRGQMFADAQYSRIRRRRRTRIDTDTNPDTTTAENAVTVFDDSEQSEESEYSIASLRAKTDALYQQLLGGDGLEEEEAEEGRLGPRASGDGVANKSIETSVVRYDHAGED